MQTLVRLEGKPAAANIVSRTKRMADDFFELLCGPQKSLQVTIFGIIRCKVLFEAMKGPVHTDLKRAARSKEMHATG